MGKKSTGQLLEDAAELGVEVDEDWSYSELLAAVKEADVEPDDELTEQPADPESAHPEEPVTSPADELVEEPADPGPSNPKEPVTSPLESPRRDFPFDELGRYTGR